MLDIIKHDLYLSVTGKILNVAKLASTVSPSHGDKVLIIKK